MDLPQQLRRDESACQYYLHICNFISLWVRNYGGKQDSRQFHAAEIFCLAYDFLYYGRGHVQAS